MPPEPIRYVATIEGAEEVTLAGSADAGYWRNALHGMGLFPVCRDDRAEILVSAVRLRWKGFRFREACVALFVSPQPAATERSGLYLVSAFQTLRLFAWIERVWFHTPYQAAEIDVQTSAPCGFSLQTQGQELLTAAQTIVRPPVQTRPDWWEGPIYLPARRWGVPPGGRMFHARLGGETEFTPLVLNSDRFVIRPTPRFPVLRQLVDSDFVPEEWRVRRAAFHAKGATVLRSHVER